MFHSLALVPAAGADFREAEGKFEKGFALVVIDLQTAPHKVFSEVVRSDKDDLLQVSGSGGQRIGSEKIEEGSHGGLSPGLQHFQAKPSQTGGDGLFVEGAHLQAIGLSGGPNDILEPLERSRTGLGYQNRAMAKGGLRGQPVDG